MSDPKQPLYDVMNYMGGSLPAAPPDDKDLVIAAYEKVYAVEDKEAQQLFRDVIQRLTYRNHMMENVLRAWSASAQKLLQACQMIGEK